MPSVLFASEVPARWLRSLRVANGRSIAMAEKKSAVKSSAKKPVSAKAALKDPKGGLTEAGRKHFLQQEGAHLKPGVKKVSTLQDIRRKGSFLRRHYGKATISPLQDKQGRPTRYALQAHAWGEPVPKTEAAVRRLAKKGTELLDRYRKSKSLGQKPRVK